MAEEKLMLQLPKINKSALAYVWLGPEGMPKSLRLEWRFVAVRWIGIIFMTPGLLLAKLPNDTLLAAYGILVVAGVYNAVVQRLIRKRPAVLTNGYLTSLGDGLLNLVMITLGGFDSPFYYILFTVTISAAMRYGYAPSLGMVGLFVSFDVLESVVTSDPLGAAFFFRSGFLFMTAILAGYLREQQSRAERALRERLSHANLLNEATAMLGASLEIEDVHRALAAAAAHLFGDCFAIVQHSGHINNDEAYDLPVIHYPPSEYLPVHEELRTLSGLQAGAHRIASERDELYDLQTLPSGRQAILIRLEVPKRQTWLTILALAMPGGRPVPVLPKDILNSFVERTALAIENAVLYRTLASRSYDLQRAYADLASAHQELLRVDEMKTEFVANVSHEFRTPLTSIRSFSEMLLSDNHDPGTQQRFLEIINSESERLTRLVSDVLDIARIESGNMEWQTAMLDVTAVIHRAARAHAALIERQGLVLRQEISADLPPIYGDADRLYQVVSNLLDNAIKFTDHGTITLRAKREKGQIVVSVEDTGRGIEAADQERIFEKFQQVGAMLTDKPGGTGLGLAICREIVKHHKGRIWVESEPGTGSTFKFSLKIPKPLPKRTEVAMAAA
ncbi:MAG: HAMP domain-containing histidine kinase [Chloroflexi bacterium]|nr:HAMP domain-containing histidine kinase [Chloroflexota bacterium]